MLWSHLVVLQPQSLCVAVAAASSTTWCATTRPTVLMNQTRWTVVSKKWGNYFLWIWEWMHFIEEQQTASCHILSFHLPLSLSLMQNIHFSLQVLVISTWRKTSGRRRANCPRILMMTLIGGSVTRVKHRELVLTLITVQVTTCQNLLYNLPDIILFTANSVWVLHCDSWDRKCTLIVNFIFLDYPVGFIDWQGVIGWTDDVTLVPEPWPSVIYTHTQLQR